MEPMFWFVDHFTKILGPICVAGVLILASSIIAICYIIGLPYYIRWNTSMLWMALIIGHWLLINCIFYYYMAFTTEPGYPPQGAMITEAVSICKRCIAPKPPRTHHCIVCNRCILKMDHHCPWLNNCVGHFNHRYFFMFCLYAWCGVMFVMTFGIPVAHDHFFGTAEHNEISPALIDFAKNIVKHILFKSYIMQQPQFHFHNSTLNTEPKNWSKTLYHSCIVYSTLLCVAVFFVLGGLIAWHAKLITNGETSIESHINKKERERFKKISKIYKNPYDFGPVKNWKIFLRIGDHRPWWHILLPFADHPPGNGLQWNFYNENESLQIDTKKDYIFKTCSVRIS